MDKYIKIRKIGEGSFGTACLVRSKQNGEHYVVKDINIAKMNSKEREESRKEVAVLAQLNHPTIITYLESFEERGSLYIVMDYCSGGDLFQKINQQRGALFPEDQILDWFVQVSLALKHIHDRKILHRDIKSQNIFLTKRGTVKLGDFGIAKVLNSTVELSRTCIGTPYYLSPEIVENKPYNNKSDVWSLGCVLYELTTLKHAFEAGNMKNLVLKIIRGSYPPVSPRYSYELRNLINVLFKRMPRERPTVNAVLKKPFLQPKIQRFLTDAQIADEFSHTVMHGAKLKKKIPAPISARPSSAQAPRKSQTPVPTPGRAPRYDPAAVYGQPVVKRSREARRSAEQLNRRPGSAGAALNPVQELERRRREMMEREQKRRQEILKKREQVYKQQHKDLVDKQQADRMNKMREEGWQNLMSSLESNEEKAIKSRESSENEGPVNHVIAGPSQPTPLAAVSESHVPLKDRGNYDKYHQFLNKFHQDGENRQREAQQRLDKRAYMQASESEESMETDYSGETPAQQAVRQAQNNRQLAEQAAERAKLVEDYLHRKRQAKLNKARAQVDVYGNKPEDAAAVPKAGQKRPVSAMDARNKEEQEYLDNLRKIRLQNFNERRMSKAQQGNPAQDLAKYKLGQKDAVRKKAEALKAQADDRIRQHKQRFEQQRREASERQRQVLGEKPKQPPSAPAKCVNMKAAPGMQITSILQAIGADEALSQEAIPVVEIEKQKADILKRINEYPPEEAPNSARSQWEGGRHGDFTMAQLPLEQTASAMEETSCDLNPAMVPSPESLAQESGSAAEQPASARRHWRSSPGQTVLNALQQAEICNETLSMSSEKSDNSILSQSGSDNPPFSLVLQCACTNITANTTVSTAITTTVNKPPVPRPDKVATPVSFVIGIDTSTPTTAAASRVMADTVTVSVAPSPIPKPRVKHSTIVLSKSEISAPGIPNITENEKLKIDAKLENSSEESSMVRLSSSTEKLSPSDEEHASLLSEIVAGPDVPQQSEANVNVERTEAVCPSDSVIANMSASPSDGVILGDGDHKKTEAICPNDTDLYKLLAMNFEADISREVGVNRTEAIYSTDNTETDVPEISLDQPEVRNDGELVRDSVSVKAWLSPPYSESEPTPVQTSPSSVSQAESTPSSDPQSSEENNKSIPRPKPLLLPKPRLLPNPKPCERNPVKAKEAAGVVNSEGAGRLFDMVELHDDDEEEDKKESCDKPSTADKPTTISPQPATEIEKNSEHDQSFLLGMTVGQFDLPHSELLRTCSEPDLTRLFSSIKSPANQDVVSMSAVKHSPTSKSLDLEQNKEVSLQQLSLVKNEKSNTITSKTAQAEHSQLQSNGVVTAEVDDDKHNDVISQALDDDNDDEMKEDDDFDDDEFEDLLSIQASMATLLKASDDDDEDDDGNFVPFSLSDSSLGDKTKIPKHRTSQSNGDDITKSDEDNDDDTMIQDKTSAGMSDDDNDSSDDDDDDEDAALRSSASGDASAVKMTLTYSDLFRSDDSDDDNDDENEGDDYDIFSRLEESRMELEEELGCDTFIKVYKSVQALHEDEDENIEEGARVAMEMLGDKQHLYPKVFQLVMADSVFTEDNS